MDLVSALCKNPVTDGDPRVLEKGFEQFYIALFIFIEKRLVKRWKTLNREMLKAYRYGVTQFRRLEFSIF